MFRAHERALDGLWLISFSRCVCTFLVAPQRSIKSEYKTFNYFKKWFDHMIYEWNPKNSQRYKATGRITHMKIDYNTLLTSPLIRHVKCFWLYISQWLSLSLSLFFDTLAIESEQMTVIILNFTECAWYTPKNLRFIAKVGAKIMLPKMDEITRGIWRPRARLAVLIKSV